MALGTVAVATGVLPGSDNYAARRWRSKSSDKVQAAGSPSQPGDPAGRHVGQRRGARRGTSTSRDADRAATPSAAPSSASPSAAPTEAPSKKPKKPSAQPSKTSKAPAAPKPTKTPTKAPAPKAPVTVSAETAAEAEVLKLVNEERAKVGCSPVSANSALSDLAAVLQ